MLLWLSALLRLISCSVGNVWYCVTGIRLSLQYAALKGGYNAISCILSCYTVKSWIVMRCVRTQRPLKMRCYVRPRPGRSAKTVLLFTFLLIFNFSFCTHNVGNDHLRKSTLLDIGNRFTNLVQDTLSPNPNPIVAS